MAEDDLPNPSGVLVYFLVVSIIYLIYTAVQVFSGENIQAVAVKSNNMNINFIYILILIVGTYFMNTNISKAMCGSREIDWLKILFITVLPWLIVFVTLYFLLEIFPGWIVPFSNTIGYLFVTLMGVESKLKNILSETQDNGDIIKAINNMKKNISQFINEFDEDPDKFKDFIGKLISARLIRPGINYTDEKILEIYKLVQIKHTIGKLFWYILAGILISSISYSFIINLTCNKTIEDAKKKHDELMGN